MVLLLPTLVLAFLSFMCSIFVILLILIPILPPNYLSRRIRPSEFGLPDYKSLTLADKTHLWFAACDLVALFTFVWQVAAEALGGPQDSAIANDPLASIRLWLVSTIRITFFFIIVGITLLHVRLARPVVFGVSQWLIWTPALILTITSTAICGVLASTNVSSLFIGLAAYSIALTTFSAATFAGLVATLLAIRKNQNLTSFGDVDDSWQNMRQVEINPHPSIPKEDIDLLKEGSSWITSNASSHGGSVSAFSFSMHSNYTDPSNDSSRRLDLTSGSIPLKSTSWFDPATPFSGRESPSLPVPSLYRPTFSTSFGVCDDFDSFHRIETDARVYVGSQSSWLTEHSVLQSTLTAWSFPPSSSETPSNNHPSTVNAESLPKAGTSGMTKIQDLESYGPGYGYSAESALAEKGLVGSSAAPQGDLDLPTCQVVAWLIHLLVPPALSLPYVFSVALTGSSSTVTSILLVLSVTLSAPLLALNIIFYCPLPVLAGLFDSPAGQRPQSRHLCSSPTISRPWSHEYKRSGSVTVVEGRRSGDVWLTNGNAVNGKRKVGRALEMLNAKPKLSVLPFDASGYQVDGEVTPPLPIQEPFVSPTPQSEDSVELGRNRKPSLASSYFSSADDSVAYVTKIMTAQKHYSALATTMVVSPLPWTGKREFIDASAALPTGITRRSDVQVSGTPRTHLRSRSMSSVTVPRSALSPSSRAFLRHRKSRSSGLPFSAITNDDSNKIDAISLGVFPLFAPGLKMGQDAKVQEDWGVSAAMSPVNSIRAREFTGIVPGEHPAEFGGLLDEFSFPVQSTPVVAKKSGAHAKNASGHKGHHFSLPNLRLDQNGFRKLSTWRLELNRTLDEISDQLDECKSVAAVGDQFQQTTLPAVCEDGEYVRPSPHPITSRPPPAATDALGTTQSSLATLIDALDSEFRMSLVPAGDSMIFDFSDDFGPQAQDAPPDSDQPSYEPTSHHVARALYISSSTKTYTRPVNRPRLPNTFQNGKVSSKSDNGSVTPNPCAGLRACSLLEGRDINHSTANANDSQTLPLALRKKQKVVTDETAAQPPSTPGKRLNG